MKKIELKDEYSKVVASESHKVIVFQQKMFRTRLYNLKIERGVLINKIDKLYQQIVDKYETKDQIKYAVKNSVYFTKFLNQLSINKEKRGYYENSLKDSKFVLKELQRSDY